MSWDLPFDTVVQVAYVVEDLDRAATWWHREMGVGPFLRRRHVPLAASVGDREIEYDHSIALAQWGEVMLELVQVHRADPPEVIAATGADRTGLHHVAMFARSLDDTEARAQARGWPTVLRMRTATGTRVAFCDARADLGHLIEYYEPSPALAALYERVAATAGTVVGPDDVIRDL